MFQDSRRLGEGEHTSWTNLCNDGACNKVKKYLIMLQKAILKKNLSYKGNTASIVRNLNVHASKPFIRMCSETLEFDFRDNTIYVTYPQVQTNFVLFSI